MQLQKQSIKSKISLYFLGWLGSLVDSVLGALFQYSGQDVESRLIVSEPGDGIRRVLKMKYIADFYLQGRVFIIPGKWLPITSGKWLPLTP